MLALAWRLARGNGRRLFLLAMCVAIGVAARAFVGTVTAQAEVALAQEARPLLGGDLEIASNEPLSAALDAVLDRVLPAGWAAADTLGFTSMASGPAISRLVEVRAVGDGFPLLGPTPLTATLVTVSDLAAAIRIDEDVAGLAIEASALDTFGIALGDALRLGHRTFVVRAVLGDDPSLTGSPFTLGPRVVVHRDAIAATGLTGFGSRLRHARLIRLPDPLVTDAVTQDLATAWDLDATERGFGARGLGEFGLEVRSARQAQFGLRRVFDRLGDFLRLAALGSLLIAAVGVAALVAATVRGRADELAVLATLGCPPRRAGRLLLLQVTAVVVIGGALGALAGGVLAVVIIALLRDAFPLPITPGFAPEAMLTGWAVGAMVAVAAALLPLASLRSLQPLAVLRGERPRLGAGWRVLPVALAALALITLIAVWEARSWLVGPLFVLALVLGAGVAHLLVGVILRGLGRWRPGPPAMRIGLANLARPGLGSASAATALAVAAALLAGPLVHRASLRALLDGAQQGDVPGLFVIDIQRDEVETFTAIVTGETSAPPLGLSPVVTARYRGNSRLEANERPEGTSREAQQDRFFRDREQRLSWRAAAGPDERIVSGRWARASAHEGVGETTLDVDFAGRINARLGDRLRFDVQGVTVEVEVVGLREVDYLGFKPNFFILVDDQLLVDAPQTWIAAVATSQATQVTRALAQALPTATVIDVSAVAERVRRIVERIVQALTVVSLFAVVAGTVVLGSLVSASARERRADAALLRVLGADDRRLRLAAGTEFAVQGLVAGVIGVSIGIGIITVGLLAGDLRPAIPWLQLLGLAGVIAVLTVITGLFVVRRTWREPPLSVLRADG